jgi:O-antigen ligase
MQKNIYYFDKFCFLLLLLFIPSVILSNAIANIILIIISLVSIYLVLTKNVTIPKWMIFYLILILFYLLHPSNFINFSFEKVIKIISLIRFPLLALLILYLGDKLTNKKFIDILIRTLVVLLIFLALDIFIQFYFKVDLFGYSPGLWDVELKNFKRYSGFFGDELIGGGYLFLNLILLLALIDNSYFKYKHIYLIFFCLIILLAIFLSGERVALFKSILLISSFLIISKSIKLKKKLFFILMIFLIGIMTLSNNSIQKRLIKSTVIEIGSLENIKKNSYHYLHYKTAIKIFNDNLLFGGGYKSFPVLCKNYDHGQYNSIDRKAISVCSTHPHNMIIQILSSGGIIGFILFCFFIFYLLNNPKKEKNYLLILFLIIYFFPLVPSGSFFSSWINFNFWFLLGILLVLQDLNKNMKIKSNK